MARFFIEGYEIDVQDPTFFNEKETIKDIQESITEILNYYE